MTFLKNNKIMQTIRSGGIPIGIQIRSRSSLVAELMGFCGFDFLYIENEHWLCDEETIESMIRVAQLTGMTPLVRIPSHDPQMISHFLDSGVMGVIVPHVDTSEQAKVLFEASKFPPIGHRGASYTSRASQYGIHCTNEEYMELSNRNTMLIPMIESVKGVNNIEAILDTGINIIRIGLNDLRLDMGLRGKKDSKEFNDAVDHVISCAKKRNVPVGASAKRVEDVFKLVKQGFTDITYDSDLRIIAKYLPDDLKRIKEGLESNC